MKSILLILIFSSLLYGTSFSQKEENRSTENNSTHVTKVESPNKLKSTPSKVEIKGQKIESVSNNNKKIDIEQASPNKTNEQADISDEKTSKDTEIRKEIENDELVLYIPNLNSNLSQDNAEDFILRIKNHFDVISDIRFYEKENQFKVNISDVEITNNSDLMDKLISQFSIQNYTITQ